MKSLIVFLFAVSALALGACSNDGGSSAKPTDPNVNADGGGDDYYPGDGKLTDLSALNKAIKIERTVPADRVDALYAAIHLLRTLPIDSQTPFAKKTALIMKTPDLSADYLQSWLQERVQYVVNDNYDINSHFAFSSKNVQYPYAADTPDAVAESSLSSALNDNSGAQVAMANIGAALYLYGKQSKKMIEFDWEGQKVGFTSPRNGFLEIGPGLFPDLQGRQVQEVVLNIFRASTLFHEARHSDGHGKTLGFMHAKCPSGHDYAGLNACDAALNGPYTVGANVQKNLMDNCKEACSAQSQTILRAMYADVASRVLTPAQLPNASAGAKAGKNWDDTPESLQVNN